MKRHLGARHWPAFAMSAALTFSAPPWLAAQVVIDFDTNTADGPIASGAVINTTYAPRGISFTSSGSTGCAASGNAFASNDRPVGFGSAPNVVSTCSPGLTSDIGENTDGMIRATFKRSATQVCVDVLPNSPTDFAVIRAYNAADAFLGQALSAQGVAGPMCVAAAGIRAVRFSGLGNFSARFDNLAVTLTNSQLPGADYDGDGVSDISIYRQGVWAIRHSFVGFVAVVVLGGANDIPVPADYDGDGKSDNATYLNGNWTIKRSSDNAVTVVGFGGPAFTPVPADYDGDGKADIAVYSNGTWSILRSSDGANVVVAHGGPGWIPVPADYDGDGNSDIAVYLNGAWSIKRSIDNGITVAGHGGPAWEPVPGDYDSDGKADIAVYLNGAWSVIRSSNNSNGVFGHGGPAWVPMPGDYDGDGKTDIAVYNPIGAWSIIRSSNSSIQVFAHGGGPTDVPLN